jgi:ubiquinone biosynthesis protein UbiJ
MVMRPARGRLRYPRDRVRALGLGISLAKQYSAQELKMLSEHAQFEDGSVSVEAGLMAMLDRMQTGAILFVLLWLAFGLF